MLLHENYTAEHITELRDRTGADPSILLDVVFEDNPYLKVIEAPIRSELT